MQIEPMPSDDGYRCWLSPSEQDRLVKYFSQEPKKRLAVELMLDGLRSEEVPRVATRDFRRLDGDEEAYKLRVREGKTGWRECPVSTNTKERAFMLKNTISLIKEDPIVDVRCLHHASLSDDVEGSVSQRFRPRLCPSAKGKENQCT